jgi:hypothetical protein
LLPQLIAGSRPDLSANLFVPRVGIVSAKDASDYEPKPGKGKRDMEPLVAVKREAAPSGRPKSIDCHIKVLSLCI